MSPMAFQASGRLSLFPFSHFMVKINRGNVSRLFVTRSSRHSAVEPSISTRAIHWYHIIRDHILRTAIIILSLTAVPAAAAPVPDDVYHLTEVEKSACTDDAVRLCSSTYPDQRKLLQCMKSNRLSLSATCLSVFDAGLKRRHL